MPQVNSYLDTPTEVANLSTPNQPRSAGPISRYLMQNAQRPGAAEAACALHCSFGKSYELDLSASTPDAVERIPLEQLLYEQPSARPAHVRFPEKMSSHSINKWIRLLPDLVSMTAPIPVTSASQPINLRLWKGRGSFLTDSPIHSIDNPFVALRALSREIRPPAPFHWQKFDAVVTDRIKAQGASHDKRLNELRSNQLPLWKEHVRVFEKASTKDPLHPGIWPSSTHPGFSVRLPGAPIQRVPNLNAANALLLPFMNKALWKTFSESVIGIWGPNLAAIRKEPTEPVTRPVIWPSPDGRGFGLHIPEAGTFHAVDLPQVQRFFEVHPEFRVLTTVQQEALHAQEKFRADVRLLWGDEVSAESARPHGQPADSATIRASSQGGFRVHAEGHQKHVATLEEAVTFFRRFGILKRGDHDQARLDFQKHVALVLGRHVKAVDMRPPPGDRQACVWPSASEPGKYGVRLTNGRYLKVNHLYEAAAELKAFGIPIPHRISDGQHVTVTGTDLPPEKLAQLEKRYDIEIVPLQLHGKTLGYSFSPRGLSNDRPGMAMLSCHGVKGSRITSPDKTFVKQKGLEFIFAGPRDYILNSGRLTYAEKLRSGQQPTFKHESQIYSSLSEIHAVNYFLQSAHEIESPEMVAKFVGDMRRQRFPKQFPMLLLNSHAKDVHLADVLQALKDTRGMPPQVLCHFCRAEPRGNRDFFSDNNFL